MRFFPALHIGWAWIHNMAIKAGVIDGTVIGGTTPAAGTFTTATATTAIADNVATTQLATTAYAKQQDAVLANPKAMSQGVEMTYAASGSTGIQVADNDNIDFGTGNFTLVWKGMIPDYTPAADTILMQKSDGTNGWVLQVDTTGVLQLILNTTTYSSTVNTSLTDKTAHKIIVVVTRETASIAGSIRFYVDGVLLGASVAITAAVPTTVNNAVPLYVMGTSAIRSAGVCYFASVFNSALTAAEVLDLYRNGINFADKWGRQSNIEASDFSAGVDNYNSGVINCTQTGNVDSIAGEDDWLQINVTATGTASFSKTAANLDVPNSFIGYKKYRISIDYYCDAGATFTSLIIRGGVLGSGGCVGTVTKGAKTTYTFEGVMNGSPNEIIQILFYGGTTDDKFYIKNFTMQPVGATLALEPEGIQPAPGQWLDSSTNRLNAMQPAVGSSLVRKKRDFEIKWTNTWAGTHELQYISGLNQAVLPPNCYIQSIIGVITGATVEDIIIGDGSDADRWVTVTTGLAAGTVAFTIANPISDGTNYKMTVDPDSNATMSIAWTIKGVIL